MSAFAQELRTAAADWWSTNWELAARLHATALEIEAQELSEWQDWPPTQPHRSEIWADQ